jgi:hypothetical protein
VCLIYMENTTTTACWHSCPLPVLLEDSGTLHAVTLLARVSWNGGWGALTCGGILRDSKPRSQQIFLLRLQRVW